METSWPHYDPTLEALLRPEKRHPHSLYSAGDPWPIEAVCAEFSRLAYFRFEEGEKAKLAEALAKSGFGPPETFASSVPPFGNWLRRARQRLRDPGAQAFGATSLDGITTILAFRGTQADKPKDLLIDLMAFPVSWPGAGRVHMGFWKAYGSLRDRIDEWLGDVRPRRLIVTGHSLGAAMACLMAALHDEAELVTFGCPLVGNRAFAEAYRRPAVRYVDCADLVATVPYTWLGYAHFGELRYVDRHGAVQSPPPGEGARKQDRKDAIAAYRRDYFGRPGNVPTRRFADHAPVNYVSAVAGLR